jgi:uncharacterized protein
MKKQVVFVHGGEVYDSYDTFIEDLKTFTVDRYSQAKKWRMSLQEELGSGFEVFLPEMPNKLNAKYAQWKIWMDKYLPFLSDGVVFIGHSLGGVFLTKYLSEERVAVSVRALYLVAAPFFTHDSSEGGDFRIDIEKLGGLTQKVQEIVLFHAKDDSVVPFSHAEAYMSALPNARLRIFEKGGHFVQESFPELVGDVRDLE